MWWLFSCRGKGGSKAIAYNCSRSRFTASNYLPHAGRGHPLSCRFPTIESAESTIASHLPWRAPQLLFGGVLLPEPTVFSAIQSSRLSEHSNTAGAGAFASDPACINQAHFNIGQHLKHPSWFAEPLIRLIQHPSKHGLRHHQRHVRHRIVGP